MYIRNKEQLEAEFGLTEEQLRRNLHMAPKKPEKPSAAYRVLHTINVLLRVVIAVLLLLLIFRIQNIDVQGNENIPDEQIVAWMGEDTKAYNSLYALYKYNIRKEELNPALQKAQIGFKLPWSVKMKVKEHPAVAMIETNEGHYVINDQGVVIASQQVEQYGTLISGLTPTSTALFKKIAFADEGTTDQILSLIKSLDNNMLEPDEVRWRGDEEGWQLRFGSTWANLGTVITEEKVQELAALYPEVKNIEGIIHLEYYESGDEIVRFEQGLPAYEEDETEEEDEE